MEKSGGGSRGVERRVRIQEGRRAGDLRLQAELLEHAVEKLAAELLFAEGLICEFDEGPAVVVQARADDRP